MVAGHRRQNETGFTYLVVLFMVAVTSTMALRGLQNSQTMNKREREEELLFVGEAFRDAIRLYYEGTPGTAKEYPPSLEALLLDSRTTTRRRPLRRIYRDPLMNDDRWGLVKTEDGRIKGVYSLSSALPIKKSGFGAGLEQFAVAKDYRDWKFIYKTI